MILGRLGDNLERIGFFGKPLGSCLTCMASVYGSLYFIKVYGFTPELWWIFNAVIFILAVSAVNFTLKNKILDT